MIRSEALELLPPHAGGRQQRVSLQGGAAKEPRSKLKPGL